MSKRPKSVSPPNSRTKLLRRLPSVERTLSLPGIHELDLEGAFGREALTDAARAVLVELRSDIRAGMDEPDLERAIESLADAISRKLQSEIRASLQKTINATGVIVHTNLGRAPLSSRASESVQAIARGYSNLELDLETGKRGSRHQHAARLLSRLFPGTDAIVVNNAAAGVMLSLNTFASGKEVIISRGELVEIGGSFRVPDILARSGAHLREVGTTNKTRIADYAQAIGPKTGVLLRVHPSNFRIVGFTESASTEELVALGEEKNIPVIEDFGSGNLLSLAPFGLASEPTVTDSLSSGVQLSIFSGDKLLGGPQAGILIGRDSAVEACRINPMARALRVDKMTYAALEATLLSFVEGKATQEIPVLRMLKATQDEIKKRSENLIEGIKGLKKGDHTVELSVEEATSKVGGGAAADAELGTCVIAVTKKGVSADTLLSTLRNRRPAVIARISEDRVLLDLRTVAPEEERFVRDALSELE